jgi:hypothetical protein
MHSSLHAERDTLSYLYQFGRLGIFHVTLKQSTLTSFETDVEVVDLCSDIVVWNSHCRARGSGLGLTHRLALSDICGPYWQQLSFSH